jgi:hypothetical protein
MRENIKVFKQILIQGYRNWMNDKMATGCAPSEVKQIDFCREFHFKSSSFTGWINGDRMPTDLNNIAALVACPYIGARIIPLLGWLPEDLNDSFIEVLERWLELPRDEQDKILDYIRQKAAAHASQRTAALSTTT